MINTTTLQGPYMFISYSRTEEVFVKRLEQDLRAHDILVWRDETNIKPGSSDWEAVIRDAIIGAYAVVLIASPNVIKSLHVMGELNFAQQYHLNHIYPIWIDGNKWLDCVPLDFSTTQYIDMRGKQYEEGLNVLVKTLQKAKERSSPSPLQPDIKPPVLPPPPPPPPPPRRRSPKRPLLIVGLVLLLIASCPISIILLVAHSNQGDIQATATTSANQGDIQATATAVASHYPFSNSLVLNDPLSHYDDNAPWDNFTYTDSGCKFTGGAYHAYDNGKNTFLACMAKASDFSNFTYEVQMTILKGDCGGIFFRSDYRTSKYYEFEVCQDGEYFLNKYLDNSHSTQLLSNSSSYINQGLNQSNLLAVEAQSQSIYLYVNNQRIDLTSDKTYGSGQIGVAAIENSNPTEVVYKNAKVWVL